MCNSVIYPGSYDLATKYWDADTRRTAVEGFPIGYVDEVKLEHNTSIKTSLTLTFQMWTC